MTTTHDVIVIGGGQAGLAAGYELKRAGLDFVILEGSERVGSSWRTRWDSLTLFTPAEYSSLPGTRFPAPDGHCPTGREFADYLESYAARHDLPVRLNAAVRRLAPIDGGFEVITDGATYVGRRVIVATGAFQARARPSFAAKLGAGVAQRHSAEYRNAAQIGDGPVVVVGGGNSGVQIAAELAASGRYTTLCTDGRAPTLPQRLLGRRVFTWLERVGYMGVRIDTRLGRKLSKRQIIIGESPRAAARRTGLRLAQRATDATVDAIVARDGQRLPAATVIWATGFRPSFDWIDAPVFDERGAPVHARGETAVPGLYFLGLSWQHTRGSALIGWVGGDARWLAERITHERVALGRVALALGMMI